MYTTFMEATLETNYSQVLSIDVVGVLWDFLRHACSA